MGLEVGSRILVLDWGSMYIDDVGLLYWTVEEMSGVLRKCYASMYCAAKQNGI